MSEIEDQREELFDDISRTNLIPSLKAQLRMAVCDSLKKNPLVKPRRPVTEESECAKNIILEVLFACGFHSTASVFYTESEMHQLPRDELIEKLQVSKSPGLLAELLLTNQSHPSISTQTENCDLNAKLEAVEMEMRRKRMLGRMQSSEDMLRRGIEQIEHEFEEKYHKELSKRMDLFRAGELLRLQAEDTRKHEAELARMKSEMEAEFRQKTADLRTQYQRDSDAVRVKQRELEREIGKWAERNVKYVATDAQISEASQIKADCEKKQTKIRAKALVLTRKVEKERRKLEDLKLAHNRAKREIEKLQLAINMYEQKRM